MKHASIQEAKNGYTCTTSEEGEYPGETHIAENLDEVHEHLKKHFEGKTKKKEPEKKSTSPLGKLAKH